MLNRRLLGGVVSAVGALAAVALAAPAIASESPEVAGAAYTLTNAPAGNAVLAYTRYEDGSLSPAGSFASGGNGSGTGLGSQDSVIVDESRRWLFAVNAGSDSISSFRILANGLQLTDTEPSGGTLPTSLTHRRGLLYVLNAGGSNNVTGFTVGQDGSLTRIFGSTRPLSAADTSPAQVGFSADGTTLIVTERATNLIDTYRVGQGGRLTGPVSHPSAGPTPFGFAVDKRNTLFVSEAGEGGGASSYRVGADGSLAPVSSMVMTGQRAACWAVVTKNGRYGYVTNAGTGNISGFAIGAGGSATLLDADGVTATTGGNPTDAALSANSRFLYVRVSATSSIAVFRIRSDGSLSTRPPLTGTPAGLAGLAAY
jgi:6-phosphogluconolactonase